MVSLIHKDKIPYEHVRVDSYTNNNTVLAKLHYVNTTEEKFTQFPTLNHFTGGIYIFMKNRYTLIYPTATRLLLEPVPCEFNVCTDYIEGNYVIPYIFEGKVYYSGQYKFEDEAVEIAKYYSIEVHYSFIKYCFTKNIYLTFVAIPEDGVYERGLYLAYSQDFNGNIYPLTKSFETNKTYVYGNVEVPKIINTVNCYNIKTKSELLSFYSENTDSFTFLVNFENKNCIVKPVIKENINKKLLSWARLVIEDRENEIPDEEIKRILVIMFDDIITLYLSFKDMVKKYRSKSAILKDIEFLPHYFNTMLFLFDGKETEAMELLNRYYFNRVIEVFNLDMNTEEYKSYV